VFTRLRTIGPRGLISRFAGPPAEMPADEMPWYAVPGRKSADHTVLFGHWAAHGFEANPAYIALDSGCVWGQSLTAVRLDDGAVFQEPAADGTAED
jgi:bis(5'-nucleosyl)-tetraphosphatase (symmetrical)